MSASGTTPSWESCADETRRLRVPGGWLYQVWLYTEPNRVGADAIEGWGQPVFVPDLTAEVKP